MHAIKTQTLIYKHDKAALEGYLAYDGATHGKRPGVLIAPTWWGINHQIRRRATALAQMGYAVLALDMYGDGKQAANAAQAKVLSAPFWNDRQLLRERAMAGVDALRQVHVADSRCLAAIGYCFGGMTVLELARAQAPLIGVVSFHGMLDTPKPQETPPLKTKILALHGADDPSVPLDQVRTFQEEMTRIKADWQMIIYGGAVHGFTNPEAGSDKSTGIAYDEPADKRSWQAMKDFFAEIF